jgi:hypothetical protein
LEEIDLDKINLPRCLRLIRNAIITFELNLSGVTVLTEAATGNYILTPMIAAQAGADRVYALTRDSRYGIAREVHEKTVALAERCGMADRIEILFSREDGRIALADIVTNLGFVRPMDGAFLRRLKRTAVIPLMFETWEYRSEDLDFNECRRLKIPVAGTNESDDRLQIFSYIGKIAIKLLFELNIEVFRSLIVVVGGEYFGTPICNTLVSAGAYVHQIDVNSGETLESPSAREAFKNAEAIVIADHQSKKMLIGPEGQISAQELLSLNPRIVVAHISGGANLQDLQNQCIPHRPREFAPVGHMSITSDYVGPRPLIDLHTAGLRVGQALAQAVSEGYSGISAEERAAELNPLVQRFGGSMHSGLQVGLKVKA